jgi:glycosyltransferase involved in cell wall biosynthesis
LTVPVSVVIITKNEERNIDRCLDSVRWASEPIVVDAHSTDRTRELAIQSGARVFERDWSGYGDQKNFGIAQAREAWVLSLDADEQVTAGLAQEIDETLRQEPEESAYRVYRPTFFMGQPLRHYGRASKDPGLVRLFRRDRARFDDRIVHECLQVSGQVGLLRHPINHFCYPTVGVYWRKIHYYAHLEALDRLAHRGPKGNRWVRAPGKLGWMLLRRGGILDGPPAWLWIAGQAYQEWLVAGEAARLRRQKTVYGTA